MMFKRLISDRRIIWSIALKELKAKYVGSILGIWWAIITPLLIMLAVAFVFTNVMKIDIERFPLFSLAGILPWFFFSLSLSDAAPSLARNSALLKQFIFSSEVIPVSSVLANFLNFIFGLIFLVPIFIFFKINIVFALAFLPTVLLLHLIFTCGLALCLCCVNVFFRDLTHLLGVILMFWFWVTPIFYSMQMVPDSYQWVCVINPMTVFITAYRNILFYAKPPSPGDFIYMLIISLVVFLVGHVLFVKLESRLVKRI